MGDGLEGRRLTGLLTVKRENFPGMRELGGGSSEGDAGAGAGKGSSPRALGAPGRGAELDRRTGGLRRGHPLLAPPSCCTPLSQPFLEERRKP